MNTLKFKMALFGVLLTVVIGSTVGIYAVKNTWQFLLNEKISEEKNKINILAAGIKDNIDEILSDVTFLSSTPPISGIVRATEQKGYDSEGKSDLKQWKDRLGIIFQEMLYAKKNYYQIRLIGVEDDGKEIVRVGRENGRVEITNENFLQKKGTEFYFGQTLQTPPSKTYLSDITLNREFGKIEIPHRLTLRAAKNIRLNSEKSFGIVIINSDYSSLLNGLRFDNDDATSYFILDHANQTLIDTRPETFKSTIFSPEEFSESNVLLKQTESLICIGLRVYYNPINPEQYIQIFSYLDSSALTQRINTEVLPLVILLLSLIIVVAIVSVLFAVRITRPLQRLLNLTNSIDRGETPNLNLIELKASDEVARFTATMLKIYTDLWQKNSRFAAQNEALNTYAIVAETDTNGKITYVNDKFVEISKYSREELLGKDHRIINSNYHPKSFFGEMWKTIKSKRVWRGEIKNRAKDGSYYWVDTTIFPIRNSEGEIDRFATFRYDISSRKNYEEQLLESTDELKRSMEIKSTFLANMSHEIRTPLNGMLGLTEILLEEDLPSEVTQQLETISACGNGLMTIVNDILDLSKIESGKMIIENTSFDLKKAIESVLLLFNQSIEKKSIIAHLEIDENISLPILGDQVRLKQIISNLLSNAIKFSHESGKIDINVVVREKVEKELTLLFSIRDYGIGIKKEAQSKLFQSFVQAETSTSRKYGGTGLGLAICAKLVDLMRGEIWFDGHEGFGTTFYFTLKTQFADHLSNQARSIEHLNTDFSQFSVLLAEDNPINKKVAFGFLNRFKFKKMEWVQNGQEAVVKMQNEKFDIIFMDIQMPVLDGLEATKQIRQSGNSEVIIVGLSANAFTEDISRAIASGMNFYLSKPLTFARLAEIMENIYIKNTEKIAS